MSQPPAQRSGARVAVPQRRSVVSVADGKPRPFWRGGLHALAFVLSVPLLPVLVLNADGVLAAIALGVYGCSMIALYGTSATYHVLARSEQAQWRLRRLDHSMIFVQIAGTYTPVCLLGVPRGVGWPLLATVWVSAVLGGFLKMRAKARLLKLSNLLYIVVAWAAVLALPSLVNGLGTGEMALLLIGALIYTGGAVLFALKLPDPWPQVFGYHEVWHTFTVAAGLAHLALVWSVGT